MQTPLLKYSITLEDEATLEELSTETIRSSYMRFTSMRLEAQNKLNGVLYSEVI